MSNTKLKQIFLFITLFGVILWLMNYFKIPNSNIHVSRIFQALKTENDPSCRDTCKLRMELRVREKVWNEILEYAKQNEMKKEHRLPKLIGIGVKKCGTHGVLNFLTRHPLIKIPERYETFFFTSPHRQQKTKDNYRKLFPPINSMEIAAEKTPAYFDFPPHNMPELIKTTIPDVKLFVIVCDPTFRVFSDYVHERIRYDLYGAKLMSKYESFEEYLDEFLPRIEEMMASASSTKMDDDKIGKFLTNLYNTQSPLTIITAGLYAYHIQRWKRAFSDSNIMIINGEDFLNNPGPIIEELQDFIGVPKLLKKEDFLKNPETGFYCYSKFNEKLLNESLSRGYDKLNREFSCIGGGKGRTRNGFLNISDSSAKRLRSFFAPYNKFFFAKVGRQFDWL